jgi:hypothetical protein
MKSQTNVRPQDRIPELHAMAAVMLPGMRQSRAMLEVAIRVLEYFESHAARDVATGVATRFNPPPEGIMREVETLKDWVSAFHKLHEKRN